ncbi:MAG: trigger factor family protein, partial [Candidatus Marinimicrobia bacterium]|nr:trigger factor family protein [Candidatus Neomarinimicrobiota bacterium]
MKIDVKIINDYTREVSIDVPWSELESDFDSTIKKFSRKIKMPGFRPGKIPRDRLMQQFQSNIEAEFMEDNIQKFYLLSLQQEEIIPVNQAEISDVHFHMNEHFSFMAKFEVEPEVTLPNMKWKSLKVQRSNYIHDEHDIEDAIT